MRCISSYSVFAFSSLSPDPPAQDLLTATERELATIESARENESCFQRPGRVLLAASCGEEKSRPWAAAIQVQTQCRRSALQVPAAAAAREGGRARARAAREGACAEAAGPRARRAGARPQGQRAQRARRPRRRLFTFRSICSWNSGVHFVSWSRVILAPHRRCSSREPRVRLVRRRFGGGVGGWLAAKAAKKGPRSSGALLEGRAGPRAREGRARGRGGSAEENGVVGRLATREACMHQ